MLGSNKCGVALCTVVKQVSARKLAGLEFWLCRHQRLTGCTGEDSTWSCGDWVILLAQERIQSERDVGKRK